MNTNMKRLFAFCLGVTLVLASLTACSNKKIDNNPQKDDGVKEQIVEDTRISFYACPDNLLHPSLYYDAIENAAKKNGIQADYSDLHNATYDFFPFYEQIKDDIKNADIAYINQESMIGGTHREIQAFPLFNSPSAMGNTLAELGFDVVNIAHNHMLDCGINGMEFSKYLFDSLNVNLLGYYPSQKSTDDIMIIERQGIKVAFLTYTYSTNGISKPDSSEFVIPYFEEELMERQIKIAKEKADFIIVSCHWGDEYSYNLNSMQKKYAKFLSDREVDVILGMHPHCIQPVEWLTKENGYKTLAVYSLGTMVSGIRKGASALAGILSLNIVKNGKTGEVYIEKPQFLPTVVHYVWGGNYVATNDTASRNFEIYYLKDYTEALAQKHAIVRTEKKEGKTTLIGGGFTVENLQKTVEKYIPEEFLPK